MKQEHHSDINLKKTGLYSSITLSLITVITFGFAISAVPISGVFCLKDCIEYPYLDSLSHYPKDYVWMFFAVLIVLIYLIYVTGIHSNAAPEKKIFSRIALGFALISSVILILCYYLQFSVIPASLLYGETDGVALLTQYNPHGIFIAMEELGYLLMSLSFLFIAPSFTGKQRIREFIRWIFIIGFVLTIISFLIIVVKFGIKRDYRFEIIVITINWLVLIVNGILSAIVFRRISGNL